MHAAMRPDAATLAASARHGAAAVRAVEAGAHLVALPCPPATCHGLAEWPAVLQMPRGNLEGVAPRWGDLSPFPDFRFPDAGDMGRAYRALYACWRRPSSVHLPSCMYRTSVLGSKSRTMRYPAPLTGCCPCCWVSHPKAMEPA